jgi:tryptophanyl-tRNA synthetase
VFAEPETIASVDAECRSAARGCVDCKMQLADLINAQLAPMRERRQELAQDPARLGRILRDGTEKARQRASDTLAQVKRAMSMDYVGLL